MRKAKVIGALLVLVAASAAAQAGVVVNVDINANGSNTYSGPGAYDNGNTYWNGFYPAGGASDPLTDADGVTHTPVTLTILGNLGGVSTYDTSLTNPAPFAGDLLNDYAYNASANPEGFRIDHLTPNGTYDIYLYAQQGAYPGYGADFTINGVTKTATGGVAGDPTSDVDSSFVEGDNYVHFAQVTANDSGSIAGEWTSPSYSNPPGDVVGSFNGLQIVEDTTSAPEPCALGLATLAMPGLLARRRRLPA